jgi:hypothetical protein
MPRWFAQVTKTAVQRLLEASQQGSSLTIHVPHDTYREQNLDEVSNHLMYHVQVTLLEALVSPTLASLLVPFSTCRPLSTACVSHSLSSRNASYGWLGLLSLG